LAILFVLEHHHPTQEQHIGKEKPGAFREDVDSMAQFSLFLSLLNSVDQSHMVWYQGDAEKQGK